MMRVMLDTSAYSAFMRGHSEIRLELRTFLSSPRVSLVGMDDDTAQRYAGILDSLWRAGTPIPTNDIWIAASAMQHGLHVLATDAHYQKVTQVIVDYLGAS